MIGLEFDNRADILECKNIIAGKYYDAEDEK